MAALMLLPVPKSVVMTTGTFKLPEVGYIVLHPSEITGDVFPAERLARHLEGATGKPWRITRDVAPVRSEEEIHCLHEPDIGHEQGYRIEITPNGIELRARTAAGLFYAMQTMAQVARSVHAGAKGEVREWPCLRIEDQPDFARRGVYHDAARGKIPELGTLLQLIDDLASLKINEFQLYVENGFEFRRHPEMYDDTNPLTSEELLIVDAACRRRHIDFVPSLTSLGHYEKILSRPAFRHLAEAEPAELRKIGAEVWVDQPWSLCVTDPEARGLLADMYHEFLPNFSSGMFNICCDEAYDLGKVRSKELADKVGVGQMYVDWIKYCAELSRRHGKRIQMWGDIIRNHPELMAQLPEDATLIEWGYEADHDFEGRCQVFAGSGRPFYVSPGTSGWMTLASRTKNAFGNMHAAAVAGLKHGAAGFLNTDWGDHGHQQMLAVSLLPFAYGAGVSWNAGAETNPAAKGAAAQGARKTGDFLKTASVQVFGDATGTFAKLVYELGLSYERIGWQRGNAALDWFLFREEWEVANYVNRATPAGLDRVTRLMEELTPALAAAELGHPDGELIKEELMFTCREILHAAARTTARKAWLAGKKIPPATLERLGKDLRKLRGEFEALWLARNKRSRVDDVLAHFDRMAKEYKGVARRVKV